MKRHEDVASELGSFSVDLFHLMKQLPAERRAELRASMLGIVECALRLERRRTIPVTAKVIQLFPRA